MSLKSTLSANMPLALKTNLRQFHNETQHLSVILLDNQFLFSYTFLSRKQVLIKYEKLITPPRKSGERRLMLCVILSFLKPPF